MHNVSEYGAYPKIAATEWLELQERFVKEHDTVDSSLFTLTLAPSASYGVSFLFCRRTFHSSKQKESPTSKYLRLGCMEHQEKIIHPSVSYHLTVVLIEPTGYRMY